MGARPALRPRPTRRGRRLLAALSMATGIALAAGILGTAGRDEAAGLRLVDDSSVVVQPGDSLWSIAVTVAPEEDTRAVVDAISEVNDLDGADLVPGQVLRLP